MTVSATYPLNSGPTDPVIDDSEADALPHALEYEDDHEGKGVSRFIEQYKNKPRMEQFLRAFLIEIQALEDALQDVYTQRWLDNATGAQLDVLGKIVGQYNPDLDDDGYRILIRARIAVNRSNGKADEIMDILLLMGQSFPETPIMHWVESYPASYALYMMSDIGTDISPDLIWGLMLDHADAAGVDASFVFGYSAAADLFRWSSSTGSVDADGSGFASSATASQGGVMTSTRG